MGFGPAPLLRHLGHRFQEFFGGLADTVEEYGRTGSLPDGGAPDEASDPKTKGKGKKQTKGTGLVKPKRAPTGYNIFIQCVRHINILVIA
jgi:hypothetical protein